MDFFELGRREIGVDFPGIAKYGPERFVQLLRTIPLKNLRHVFGKSESCACFSAPCRVSSPLAQHLLKHQETGEPVQLRDFSGHPFLCHCVRALAGQPLALVVKVKDRGGQQKCSEEPVSHPKFADALLQVGRHLQFWAVQVLHFSS